MINKEWLVYSYDSEEDYYRCYNTITDERKVFHIDDLKELYKKDQLDFYKLSNQGLRIRKKLTELFNK